IREQKNNNEFGYPDGLSVTPVVDFVQPDRYGDCPVFLWSFYWRSGCGDEGACGKGAASLRKAYHVLVSRIVQCGRVAGILRIGRADQSGSVPGSCGSGHLPAPANDGYQPIQQTAASSGRRTAGRKCRFFLA